MPEVPPMTPPSASAPGSPQAEYPTVDPTSITVIEGVEHKLDSMLQRDVHVYLWVDINGLKIVDKKSKHVQWSARLNTIVQVGPPVEDPAARKRRASSGDTATGCKRVTQGGHGVVKRGVAPASHPGLRLDWWRRSGHTPVR
jgi:hypothetical protein